MPAAWPQRGGCMASHVPARLWGLVQAGGRPAGPADSAACRNSPLEQGLDGVRVCLVGFNWCNYTEYGDYEFDLLPPGEYTVQVQEFPRSYHRTSPLTAHITLSDAEIRSDIDFGFRRDHRRIK